MGVEVLLKKKKKKRLSQALRVVYENLISSSLPTFTVVSPLWPPCSLSSYSGPLHFLCICLQRFPHRYLHGLLIYFRSLLRCTPQEISALLSPTVALLFIMALDITWHFILSITRLCFFVCFCVMNNHKQL